MNRDLHSRTIPTSARRDCCKSRKRTQIQFPREGSNTGPRDFEAAMPTT